MIAVHGDTQLLQVVGATHPVGRLAHLLHGWDKKSDEHGDDGDDNEQFDKCEAVPFHDLILLYMR